MNRFFSPLFLVAGILAGCSTQRALLPGGISAPGQIAPSASATATKFLYVASASGGVSVYPLGTTVPIRKLSAMQPMALAFDRSGNLYVANHNGGPTGRGFVSVFAPKATAPKRTISSGVNVPYSLSFDSKGNLYVANYIRSLSAPQTTGSITVYKPDSGTPYLTITTGANHPHQIAVAAGDELIAATKTTLQFYSAGKTTPSRSKVFDGGLAGIGLDGTDHIFAGSLGGCPNYCFAQAVACLTQRDECVHSYWTNDGSYEGYIPAAFAFDSLGYIYIAVSEGPALNLGSVIVFPPLPKYSRLPLYVLGPPVKNPTALATDQNNNIIVGDNGAVEVFHSQALDYVITQGISGQVTALAIASH